MHTILRFAAGATGAFIFCEFMGWYPTFLAPLLAGMLLANLPTALPIKLGIVLVVIQAAGAYAAYSLSSLLLETPLVLFGTIALILLLCFANLARGGQFLPILLILICFSTVPIVTMMAAAAGGRTSSFIGARDACRSRRNMGCADDLAATFSAAAASRRRRHSNFRMPWRSPASQSCFHSCCFS